jgi:hypothetical protein
MNILAFADALEAAARALRDAEPAELSEPDFYTEESMPPGEKSWSALLRRSRAGCFTRRRLGRHVVIDGASYRAWLATRSGSGSIVAVSTSSAARLERLGLRLVGGTK